VAWITVVAVWLIALVLLWQMRTAPREFLRAAQTG
jgi:hypothetical protein